MYVGMTPQQYWDSTLKEVTLYIDIYNEKTTNKQRANANNIYNMAYLTTMFIGCSLNKNNIPSVEELFPNLFDTTNDGLSKEEYDKRLAQFQEEQIIRNFERINKVRKKGGNK